MDIQRYYFDLLQYFREPKNVLVNARGEVSTHLYLHGRDNKVHISPSPSYLANTGDKIIILELRKLSHVKDKQYIHNERWVDGCTIPKYSSVQSQPQTKTVLT